MVICDDDDDTSARNIQDVLKPFLIAIKALSRNKNTLLRADEVLKFFIKKNVH